MALPFRSPFARGRLAAIGLVLALGAVGPAHAHESAASRIDHLTEHLRAHPDPATFLERAELRRIAGDWDAAERDCDQALALDPELHPVLLSRARIALDRGDADLAVARARTFLARTETADGTRILARALAEAGRPAESAAAFRRTIALATPPDPGDFFACALQEVAAGRVDAALAGLDDGCARLGPLRALQALAIRIARDAGRPGAALARLDALVDEGGRTESWHAERGRILAEAGRDLEAWAAFSEALAAIERLHDAHRSTPAIRQLEAEVEERLRISPERPQP